jgi:hypothetical protein
MESFVNSRKGGRPLLRVVRKNGYARGTLAYGKDQWSLALTDSQSNEDGINCKGGCPLLARKK